MAWLPIRYRDFWDVPRAFLVERSGTVYYFDCPFDDGIDEYPAQYAVYQLPRTAVLSAMDGTWEGLARAGSAVGTVRVALVHFDITKRAFIDDSVFDVMAHG